MRSPKVGPEQHEQEVEDLRSVIATMRDELDSLHRASAEPARWLDRVSARKVLVHLKTDQTIDGLLVWNLADGVVLRAASMVSAGGGSTPMAGEVFIPHENVLLVQHER